MPRRVGDPDGVAWDVERAWFRRPQWSRLWSGTSAGRCALRRRCRVAAALKRGDEWALLDGKAPEVERVEARADGTLVGRRVP